MTEETTEPTESSILLLSKSKKVKVFSIWLLAFASGIYFGYILAKSTYSSVHDVCGTHKYPDELMKNECFFQLVGYVLRYEYVGFYMIGIEISLHYEKHPYNFYF